MSRSQYAYQLKITLRGSKPPIWRRVVVPGNITLGRLDRVIQTVMGWLNVHLHAFQIDGIEYSGPGPDGYIDDSHSFEDEAEYRICDVLRKEKMKFRYLYDFGDGWEHIIVVEKILPPLLAPKGIVCTGGKMNCPREDCGGLWGHYSMIKILADPMHPRYAETIESMGTPFDPEEFDMQQVNTALKEMGV